MLKGVVGATVVQVMTQATDYQRQHLVVRQVAPRVALLVKERKPQRDELSSSSFWWYTEADSEYCSLSNTLTHTLSLTHKESERIFDV